MASSLLDSQKPIFIRAKRESIRSFDPHISHSPFNSLSTISDRLVAYGLIIRSSMAVFLRLSDNPPKMATSGFLPSRSTVTFKLTRGPFRVCVFDLRRFHVFTSVVLFFPAIVLSSDVSIVYLAYFSRFRFWAMP